MKQAAAHTTTKHRGSDATLGVSSIAFTFLDTTWRMAVPVVLFTILGIVADRRLHTKPWLTLPSVLVGFALAILLVKRQLAAVAKADEQTDDHAEEDK